MEFSFCSFKKTLRENLDDFEYGDDFLDTALKDVIHEKKFIIWISWKLKTSAPWEQCQEKEQTSHSPGETFVGDAPEKGLLSKTDKELLKFNSKKTNNPNKNGPKDPAKETVRYLYTPMRMALLWGPDNTESGGGCGATETTPIHSGGGAKWYSHLGRQLVSFLQNWKYSDHTIQRAPSNEVQI